MLPCTPSSSTNLGMGWEPRFRPLFLEFMDLRIIDSGSVGTLLATSFVRMMVSSGLAGAHVQPCPRNKIELLAISSWLVAKPGTVWLKLMAKAESKLSSGSFGKKPGL